MTSQNSLSYVGIDPRNQPRTVVAARAPTSNDISFPLGARWIDSSANVIYDQVAAGNWESGGNAAATTSVAGIVLLNEDGTLAAADNTDVPTSLAVKTYADSLAISGAPDASETVKGIAELASTAEAVAVTDDLRIVTPAKVGDIFAAPPSLGSGTPAAGAFTTLAASGLSSLSGSATVLTGGTALNLGSDNSADAVNLAVGTSARAVGIANSAAAHTVTIGSSTGAASLDLLCGTGNFTLDGAAASTYTIGATTTSGTFDVGGTSQTGTFTLAPSDAAMTMNIANGNGTKTVNVGSGINGNTISVGNGANSTAQIINLSGGANAANSTVNVLSGNASAGTQTCNILTGTRAGALNLATGAAAHVVAVGNASAGNITVDTATSISLDGVTASNFTLSGAGADLSLVSGAGRVVLNGEEAAVSAVELVSAAGGISAAAALQLSLISSEAAAADAVRIQASAADGGIDCDSGTGGTTIDSTGAISIDAAAASNMSVTGAGIDLTLDSAAGRVIVNGEEAAVSAVELVSAAGGISASSALQLSLTSSENAADAIVINANAGGVDLTAAGAAGEDIDVTCTAGSVNITGGEAIASAVKIDASSASGGVQLTAGSEDVSLLDCNLKIAGAGKGLQIETGAVTDMAGTGTLVAGTDTILNTNISAGDYIFVTRIGAAASTTLGVLSYTISAGASFTVNSLILGTPGSVQTGDASTYSYFIVRPL